MTQRRGIILAAVLGVGLVVLAWRRGWPGRTTAQPMDTFSADVPDPSTAAPAPRTVVTTLPDRLRALATRVGAPRGEENNASGDVRADVAPQAGLDPIPEGETNDPTLVARVESELFRDATLPKGKLNIDAANGVVTLRGTLADDALAKEIVERVGAVEGVAQVVDLLQRRR